MLKQYCLEGILAKESSTRTKDLLLWSDLLIFMKFYGVHYLIFSLILTKIDISIQVQDNKA